MIKSMTGFGKAEVNSKYGRFSVEIRTVNHRYFDVSSRIPNSLSALEDRIKDYIHKYIKRGKVNFSLSHKKGSRDLVSIKLDDFAIGKYYKMLNKIRKKFRLKDDIKLSHIFSFPDVIIQEQPEHDIGSIWPALEEAIRKAAMDCDKMREREGKALCKDLTRRIQEISYAIERITDLSPRLISEHKNRLEARVKEILKQSDYDIDRPRLETELALFARQCDISEEITRAISHIEALKNTLTSSNEAGRRLDFILQELQREINTLGSKANNVVISRLVLDIKSEIEKIREQVQNVE